MAILTFSPDPKPSPGTTRKPKIKLLEAEFGDGYTQSAADGINHIRRALDLRWETLTVAQERTLDTFFMDHKGCVPFLYAPSDDGATWKYTCKEWESRVEDNGFRSFNAKLEQSFNHVDP